MWKFFKTLLIMFGGFAFIIALFFLPGARIPGLHSPWSWISGLISWALYFWIIYLIFKDPKKKQVPN